MHLLAPALALAALLAPVHVGAKSHVKIQLNVPTLIQCEEAKFVWEGGKPPFKLWAQSDSRDPAGRSPIADNTSAFSAKWLVDAPAGTRVKIRIEDGKKHWVNTYAEVHLGSSDACVNPDYDEPTEPARPPPPSKVNWWRGFEFLVLGGCVLLAMVGIAAGINRAGKKNEEEEVRGEYARVGDAEGTEEFQMSRVGGRVTRRITPTRPNGEEEEEEDGRGEEYRSLIPGRRE